MRTLFSHIHQRQFRPGQWVTVAGRTGVVVGWTSRRRGATGKSLVVKITGKSPRAGRQFAYAASAVQPRRGNKGRGPLGRVG